jgi:hypothetical protein
LYTADWDRLPLADSWCDAALPYAEARPGEETLEGVGGSFVLTGRQLGLSDGSVRTYFGTGYPDREEWEEKYAAITGPELLKCPEARSAECGYAFNSALSGLSEGAVSEPSRVVLLFESDARWNATGGESSIAWGRHPRAGSDSAIVVFFDGSASPRTRAELASSEAWQAAD